MSVLLYLLVSFGLGWPLAQRLALDPVEKVVTAAAVSVLLVFLVAWLVYVCALPPGLLWGLPVAATAGLIATRRTLIATWGDASARTLLLTQLLIVSWCVGWLALVVSYSGGGWTGDWFGHWQRTSHFLERGPRDILFNGFEAVTARPPLVNVVIGAFLAITQRDFAHYQLAMTVLSSLAFLPAALLARRFGSAGRDATPLLAVLFMANPMMVQNATFAWTKLPTVFYVLAALYYFLRAHDPDGTRAMRILCALCLGAGILAHYSAGPYALLLAAAWLAFGWRHRSVVAWWKTTAAAATAGALVLATWFGWALATYGVKGTLLTNTSVTDQAPTATAQLAVAVLNLRDTLVPHMLRGADFSLFAQTSPWGWWRDWFFQGYQVNLFLACGSVGWLAILATAVPVARGATRGARTFWLTLVIGGATLGVAVHAARDVWGLAHICLQPLVLLGLAFLAARWSALSTGWRRLLLGGTTADLGLGIVLQFGAQSFVWDQWFTPGRAPVETFFSYSQFTMMNLRAKLQSGWVFLGDGFAGQRPLLAVLLALLLALALIRAARPSPAATLPSP